MRNISDIVLILLKFLSRSVTGRVGYFLVLSGIFLISPPLVIDLINLGLARFDLGQIPPSQPMPILGSVIALAGFILILINHFWIPKHKLKEVIGIRHNSLGSFPKEDVCKDLPLLQRLETYREINVDHSDSYTQGVLHDHQSVVRRLERVPLELSGLLNSAPASPIAYYGLPHIPLAFYLGYLLSDNKYNIDLYDLNNLTGRWNQLSGLPDTLDIVSTADQVKGSVLAGDVVMTIGVSYPVHDVEISELGLANILATVHINARNPQRQIVTNQYQIDTICAEFRRALEAIKNNYPNRQRIHLFYSGPVSLCFALGRCVSERIDPELVVYNYSTKSKPRYSWSLSINSPEHSSALFSSTIAPGDSHAAVQHA